MAWFIIHDLNKKMKANKELLGERSNYFKGKGFYDGEKIKKKSIVVKELTAEERKASEKRIADYKTQDRIHNIKVLAVSLAVTLLLFYLAIVWLKSSFN